MNALLTLGRAGDSAMAGDLGFVGLLLGENFSAAEFVDRILGPVVRHDAQRGTVLAQTLEVYYGTGQSLVASAKTLHVHPNTVTQRLDRVKRLLGPDWNTPANAVDVQLALRLLPLTPRGPAVSLSRAPHATPEIRGVQPAAVPRGTAAQVRSTKKSSSGLSVPP